MNLKVEKIQAVLVPGLLTKYRLHMWTDKKDANNEQLALWDSVLGARDKVVEYLQREFAGVPVEWLQDDE